MCQFYVCYSNIYNLYMYKHETIRNQLIGYLTFILVIGNLETTDRLTGYSVKLHSTNLEFTIFVSDNLVTGVTTGNLFSQLSDVIATNTELAMSICHMNIDVM